ncbi:MAG: hypothetical protein U1F71_05650 [Verrucomicrobiaceae bacterium]
MAYESIVICGLIASPGDMQEARDLMPTVFRSWNNAHAEREGITLRSLLWEKDAVPDLRGKPQAQINKQLVGKADFLIAFFNNRVGTPTENEISGTVEEINQFEAAQKPVLLYFACNGVDRKTATSPQFKKLTELQKQISKRGFFGTFKNVHELQTQIAEHLSSVVHAIKTTREATSQKEKAEAATIQVAVERNRFLKRIVTRLNLFEKLTDRCANRNPELKQEMARFFWRHAHGELVKKNIRNLFFESGSTIVYLAEEFVHHCKHLHSPLGEWTIKTNNIVTYLNFVLFERIDIVLSPYGPPDNEYGATFGSLQRFNLDPPSDEDDELNLDPRTQEEIDRQASELLPLGYPSLILATASGLELDEKHRYPGLHVGSFHNMLFKRAILKSLHPTVIFLDENKISLTSEGGNFIFGTCYPVFDHLKVWQSVLTSAPLAFCFGFQSKERMAKTKAYFERYGFKEKISENGILFMTNPVWKSVIGRRVDVRI